LALLVGLAAVRLADWRPVEEVRVRTFDWYQRLDPREKTQKPVVVVDIDDRTLKAVGQWPWPRTKLAGLTTDLTRLGAAAIGFDVMFPEPDRLNPDLAVETFRNLDEATREKLRALPSNDQAFAEAIKSSRVVLGEAGLPASNSELDEKLPQTGLATLGEDP